MEWHRRQFNKFVKLFSSSRVDELELIVVVVIIVIVIIVPARATASAALKVLNNGLDNFVKFLHLLLVVLELSVGVVSDPLGDFLTGLLDGLLVVLGQLAAELLLVLDLGEHGEGGALKLVARLDGFAHALVFLLEFLGGADHFVDLFL